MPYIETGSPEQFRKTRAKNGIFLVYFFSDGCPPCREIAPKLNALMEKLGSIPWTKIDPARFPDIAAPPSRYFGDKQSMVFTVPVIIVYDNGREAFKASHFIDINKLEQVLTGLLEQR